MPNEGKKPNRIWLLLLPVALFLVKDIVATILVLSHEPAITEQDTQRYAYALLPGSLLVVTGSAPVINLLFGAIIGLILYLLFGRR